MASFQIGQQCLSDPTAILQAIQAYFPQYLATQNGASTVFLDRYLTASAFNATTGVFTYSTKNFAGTVLQTNAAVTYSTCANENLPFSVGDILFGVACVFALLISFNMGMKR